MHGASAAPLMLLPGLLCDARMFAAQRASFPDAQVIDGFGPVDDLVRMAQIALAAAPPRISLLGHSMGARVALEMIRLAPDRIERLALVSTGVHEPRDGEAARRHALLEIGRRQGAAALVDRWLPGMVAPERIGDAALVEPLHRMCVQAGVDTFAAQIAALLGRPEVESLLPSLRCPTLVLVGGEDAWSPPPQHAEIAAAIPGARLRMIPGAGHMLPAEAPEAFDAAVAEWLALPISNDVHIKRGTCP
ncbi:alpha/beta fold hydrolase [Sphingomonas sp. PB2P19]|uniref:alpha/beta fold hydrolase n=1 Tax=Sphingomonas rhamnosi TaxID=3096156 RepID=UPI002FCA836A